MSDFNQTVEKIYQDASGKGAHLGTLETVDHSAENLASVSGKKTEAPVSDDTTHVQEGLELDLTDTLNALFEGTNPSPEFVSKFKLIFESALNEKSSLMEEAILEASKEIIEEKVAEIAESLTDQINDYLAYVVEEWMTENKLAVENGLKTELAENFIVGLKELFENSFIDVPEEKYDVLDELFNTNSKLEQEVNCVLAENMDLKNNLLAQTCANAFVEISDGLADTEVEKLVKLTENLDFNSLEQYTEKVKVLRHSYFGKNSNPNNTLVTDETTDTNTKPAGSDPLMEGYVKTISHQLKLTNPPKVKK